jgi:hypothetical protein
MNNKSSDGSEEVYLIRDLVSTYGGQWLGLEVVERDANFLPRAARLVARASSRLELREKVRHRDDIYITFAGPVAPAEFGILY